MRTKTLWTKYFLEACERKNILDGFVLVNVCHDMKSFERRYDESRRRCQSMQASPAVLSTDTNKHFRLLFIEWFYYFEWKFVPIFLLARRVWWRQSDGIYRVTGNLYRMNRYPDILSVRGGIKVGRKTKLWVLDLTLFIVQFWFRKLIEWSIFDELRLELIRLSWSLNV